jgi:hypothetical protein
MSSWRVDAACSATQHPEAFDRIVLEFLASSDGA